jgi:vitamin B12 transporter
MYRFFVLILSAAAICGTAWTQDAVSELEETVVTATRIETGVLDAPGLVTVITRADIARSGATDVAELIAGRSRSGVIVADYGTNGGLKTASIRGSASEQVLILLDGVRLNSGRDGAVDLSSIPLGIVERIEIVRGGESSLYGTSAIGGVINIITRKPDKPEVSLSLTNTGYIPHDANAVTRTFPAVVTAPAAADPLSLLDAQSVELFMAGRLGDALLFGGGSFGWAANAYAWNDTAELGDWRLRTNARNLEGSGFVGLELPLPGGRLAVKGFLQGADTGAPGSLTMVSTTAEQTDVMASGLLSWKTDRFLLDDLTLDAKAFYRYDELTYVDPAYSTESLHRTNTAGLDAAQSLSVSDALSFIYGMTAGYDNVESTNYGVARDRLNLALFVAAPVSPLDGLTVTPSARYDWFSDFPGAFSYQLSAVWLTSDASALKAAAGGAYRVPTLNDLYWFDPSGYTAGNPDLVPETSYNAELGYSLQGQKLSLDVLIFARLVQNNIVWASSGFIWTPLNYRTTFFPGAELQAKAAVWDFLSIGAGYTFIYSFLLDDGATAHGFSEDLRVPYAPMNAVDLEIEFDHAGHSAGVELRYVGSRYTDGTNTETVDGFFLLNASYRIAVSGMLGFSVAAQNILNAEYQVLKGYPMPPFSIRIGVDLKI